MKTITKLILIVAAIFAWGTTNATQYCQTTITASDAVTNVKLSCQLISAGNYQIKIESDVAMTNLSPGCYCNINGVGGYQLIAQPGYVRSSDGKTITIDIPSLSGPNLYTPLYILMPGEKIFTWPSDVDWTGSCAPIVADTDIPTAFTATAGTIGATGVELLLNATDNSGAISYTISYGSGPTVVSTTGVSATPKSYVVTGLTPETAYTFSVIAKDAAGNAAANNPIVVPATTVAIPAVTNPTVVASKVISVYSGTYTNLPTVKQDWYGNTFSTVTIAGNEALKNTSICCFGYDFNDKPINVSTMTKLHVDIYPVTLSSMSLGITDGTDHMKSGIALTADQWNSIDLNLSELTGANLTNVNQVGFWNLSGTFYLDNLYFYNESTTIDTEAPTAFTASAGTVKSDEVQLLLNATDDSGAISYSISYGSTPTIVTAIGTSNVEKSVIISGLTGSTAYSFSVTAKDATGNEAANSPIIVEATTANAIAASPTPTPAASDVLSIYSDTYSAAATGLEYQSWWNAGWSDVTLANAGNAKKIIATNGGGGVGIQFANLNVSEMTYVHMDVYPTDATSNILKYNVVPVGGGGTGWTAYPTLIANQWNSVDILVSTLGLPGTSVFQVGFGTFGGDGTFYVDNIFFSKTISTSLSNPIANDVRIFPNPMQNQLNISANSEIKTIEVRNLIGQLVKSVNVNTNEKVIDMNNFTVGNYIVSVKMLNRQISTQKVVKL